MKTIIGSFKSPEAAARYRTIYQEAMSQTQVPDKQFDVETSYGSVRVYQFGERAGPPVVLVSGMAATSASWAQVIPVLSQRYPVFALDTLGEPGLSVQKAPIRSREDQAAWLNEVLRELGLTGVHLVGASTGGFHAVNLVIHAPERIATLIVLDPTTVTVSFGWGVMWRLAIAMITRRLSVFRWALRWAVGSDAVDPPELRLPVAGIREYTVRLPPQTRPSEARLRSIKLPVLAMFAKNSAVHNSVLAAERLRNWLPHAEVDLWTDANHSASVLTDDDRFTNRVLDFVQRHTSGVK
jgi:pimeloyl-ACP methyl ester carboxylesterase